MAALATERGRSKTWSVCLKEMKEKDGGMTDGREEETWTEEDEREERKNWGLMGGAERVCTHHVCWAGGRGCGD